MIPRKAYAHVEPNHPACWDSSWLYLSYIKIYDDHETGSNPEIYVRTRVHDGLDLEPPHNWDWMNYNTKSDLEDVDDEDTAYEFESPNSVKLYEHDGYYCTHGWTRHDIKVREEDLYPNPNDDIAAWEDADTNPPASLSDGTDFGYPGDADIIVFGTDPP